MCDNSQSISMTLLNLLRLSDGNAWQRFVEEFGPLVYSWCRQRRLDQDVAGDICQDVFMATLRNIQQFQREKQEDTFRGWLWMVTQHKIRDHFRRLAKSQQGAGGSSANRMLAEIEADESLSTCDLAAGNETQLAQALQTIQQEVESSTWSAFWRTVVDGQETRVVAEELGLSTGAIRVNRFRVLRRLREIMSSLTAENPGTVL